MALADLTQITVIVALGLTVGLAFSHRKELTALFGTMFRTATPITEPAASTSHVVADPMVDSSTLVQIISKIEAGIEKDAQLIEKIHNFAPERDEIILLDDSFEAFRKSLHNVKKIAS